MAKAEMRQETHPPELQLQPLVLWELKTSGGAVIQEWRVPKTTGEPRGTGMLHFIKLLRCCPNGESK